MNILKVVVDGGWVIRQQEMQDILSMVELAEDVSSLSLIIGSNEKVIKQIALDTVDFFKVAMKVFGMREDLIADLERQKATLIA